jgi:serine protease Do
MESQKSLSNTIRTHRLAATFVLLGTLSAGVLAGSVLTGTVHGAPQQKIDTSDAAQLHIPPVVNESNQFTRIAKEVGPAVVNINTESLPKQSTAPKARRGTNRRGQGDDGDQGDMQDFFNRFFGGQGGQGGGDDDDDGGPAGGERRALGSGFIVDPRGYIVTNNHVVDKADRINVRLSTDPENDPGRPAHVVGVDKDTDLAVIKIDAPNPLPTVKLGNSDGAQVGDWVLAIGSPFSLSQTVTAGIVSAKNRVDPSGGASSQFQKFIQTDAAINPGNSGGPLLDMSGSVIGVNTAIYTQSMGSVGVGFAVPSNTVISVYNMLVSPEHKVTRGSIGISFQPGISSAVGRVYGFAKGGVLVASVTPGYPAAKAGIKPQDVITAIDGQPVKDGDDLVSNISPRHPGSTVRLTYLRDGHEANATVTIADRAEMIAKSDGGSDDNDSGTPTPPDAAQNKFGMTVNAVPSDLAGRLKIKGGVVISNVKPGSFADDLPLTKGDIITEINRKPITDLESFRAAVAPLKSGDDVVFVVRPAQARANSNFVGGRLP